ncbi:tagaturonate epimerase family protein [Granulicella sp. L46]|jgi:tagaturonate epimerase|uniref:tagaturonate epimerase family protein n=1 Tax=Granulicella sp. L46 TaxID=1641865 RepID=UPI00131DE54C|nr:tagaturonate epimerase family protein [Granulicella sp. L46]
MNRTARILGKFSIGMGDRFAHQAKAQLQACVLAADAGIEVVPVWNKSNREHVIIGSQPAETRKSADEAVRELKWTKSYFCDADHINLETVGGFLAACDFYTIDVADFIGKKSEEGEIDAFVQRHKRLVGNISLPGVNETFEITELLLRQVAEKFLAAVQQAGLVYRKIESAKGPGNFISEISMDETDSSQSPVELLLILAAIKDENIPVQTIAPKFSGQFHKGVDYIGDAAVFKRELDLDFAAIAFAIDQFGLPSNLKLSVHSGSDKFSIYPMIHTAMQKFDSGIHLKTAGTTWLEELIGLAESGGQGLDLAKEIYSSAWSLRAKLCLPYATVIDIDESKLPKPSTVAGWSSEQFASALRHDEDSASYDVNLRQLLHVGFKVAADLKAQYIDLIKQNEPVISRNVTSNLYDRHIVPVFIGEK